MYIFFPQYLKQTAAALKKKKKVDNCGSISILTLSTTCTTVQVSSLTSTLLLLHTSKFSCRINRVSVQYSIKQDLSITAEQFAKPNIYINFMQ